MSFINLKDLINKKIDYKTDFFLTFDIDWCSDEVLAYTLDIIEKYNIKVTFFITHDTVLLERMRKNNNIELGIHPNFNFLLNGDFRYGSNFKEVVDYYLKIVPEAISVRSHSITQNSQILQYFYDVGLKIDSNVFVPFNSNIELNLWKCSGLLRVPYFFADDLRSMENWTLDAKIYLNTNGLKVFDFHPIHIFLNTEILSRYNNARDVLKDHVELSKHINTTVIGTKDLFVSIIKEVCK